MFEILLRAEHLDGYDDDGEARYYVSHNISETRDKDGIVEYDIDFTSFPNKEEAESYIKKNNGREVK